MQLSFLRICALMVIAVTVPVTVSACEGECIVGITNAFLGNYTKHIDDVINCLAKQVNQLLHDRSKSTTSYFDPIVIAYKNESYPTLQHAIFPGYFHGKCQRGIDNVDPSGCPNPDCPVVCGTPGSLVHFYSKLRAIVFDCIQGLLATLTSPGSPAYDEMEKAVIADATSDGSTSKNQLRGIMRQLPGLLAKSCGGTGELSECSWESEMKSFILSFP